jgi:hypothetical protein
MYNISLMHFSNLRTNHIHNVIFTKEIKSQGMLDEEKVLP